MIHELVLLSKQIDWEAVKSEFAEYYCAGNGRPRVLIRKMVGMMHLKDIDNLRDEGLMARWMENPYKQYFTSEKVFQARYPINLINILSHVSSCQSYYQKTKVRKKFQKRVGIESVIGHLKSDHRMMCTFLKGTWGDVINTLMAPAAYNMRHWINKNALSSIASWLKMLVRCLENVIFVNIT